VISFNLDGSTVAVPDDGCSLLEALRDRVGVRTLKDGCSPQGQCGCCTVLVDDQPRVACVTPAQRVAGRSVTTVAGLDPDIRERWTQALCATGGSQCGFCTPGIIMRLASEQNRAPEQSLLAHLCRCTGWQTIVEAAQLARATPPTSEGAPTAGPERRRDFQAASRRATIEGGSPQVVGPRVALGEGGFADDDAPVDALVAVLDAGGNWVVAETLSDARRLAGKVQGRRTTEAVTWPLALPDGDWARTLRTTWVEPAYLEPDASWCLPGGEPRTPLANGGAFGSKRDSPVAQIARQLADRHGRPVRVLYSREDVVRHGAKRPPIAAGIRSDRSGLLRIVRTEGVARAIARFAPGFVVDEVDVPGPRTSLAARAAGWAEAAVMLASLRDDGPDEVVSPDGARAVADVDDSTVHVAVRCGRPLDEVVLRSYCIGAAHMALGWVRREAIVVDSQGEPRDLTIRSFGILRANETPHIEIVIEDDDAEPVNGSDAVFAAVAVAAWRHAGFPDRWPAGA
jgi:aerobic-type carbon monoxide dehydrogenase small subunit (CoxS/CutS family)